MGNQINSASNEHQTLPSTQPMSSHNPNFSPESNPSAPPPPSYPGPPQYPSPSGMVCLQYYPPPAQGMGGYPPQQLFAPPSYNQQTAVIHPEQPPDTKYPIDQQQQQQPQQQQFVIGTPVVADQGPPVSMVGALVLSVITYFCGGFLCGAMAFTLAVIGRNSSASGNRRGAVQLRNISYGLSIFGIVATLGLLAIYLGVFLSPAFTSDPYQINSYPTFNYTSWLWSLND